MAETKLRKCTPDAPSTIIDQRMKLYSVAAAAGGVSVLALAQPAMSEVIITKKTIPIPISQYGGTQHLVPISLNNDSVNDFSFSLYSFAYHSADRILNMWPLEGGAVVAQDNSALALMPGAKIGPSARFSSRNNAVIEDSHANFGYTHSGRSYYNKTIGGKWGGNPKNRYLGVRFLINGKTHYGWIRLTVTTAPRSPIAATITAYAYETVPNKTMTAGSSSSAAAVEATVDHPARSAGSPSLGVLALGADGLNQWRGEISATAGTN